MVLTCGCAKTQGSEQSVPEAEAETVVAPAPEAEAELTGNDSLNALAQFYAGMPVADSLSAFGQQLRRLQEKSEWKSYARQMDALWSTCLSKSAKIDSIGANEMADIREHCTNVLYTFGAADFVYPTSFFPTAENYYLIGLEKAGSPLSEKKIGSRAYICFLTTFRCILSRSYFITKDMKEDMNSEMIDGTMPIIMVMMARMDREIVKIGYKTFTEEGGLADSSAPTNVSEIQYFKRGSRQLQHFYYISGNLHDSQKDTRFAAFLDHIDYAHTVSYLKAASFLMHDGKNDGNGFTKARAWNLRARAIVEEDSGVPFKYLNNGEWDITLYGSYVHPIGVFSEACYQKDLKAAYDNSSNVHPLNFQLGYDKVSNLIVARKK